MAAIVQGVTLNERNLPCLRPVKIGSVLLTVAFTMPTRPEQINEVLPNSADFKAPGEFWNSLRKTVLIKRSFTGNKGPLNTWNGRKAKKYLVRRTCKYCSYFLTMR